MLRAMVVGRRIRWLGGMRRCAHLDERQRRLLLGAEASELGRGGITLVAEATGADADMVSRGVREIEGVSELSGRVRAPGGGRKKLDRDRPTTTAGARLHDVATASARNQQPAWTTHGDRGPKAATTARNLR
jgi:hypothetical protein